jgi:hypothetical protein
MAAERATFTADAAASLLLTTPDVIRRVAAAQKVRQLVGDRYPQVETVQAYVRYLVDEVELRSSEEAAELIMVTATWLRALEKQGWFTRVRRSTYRMVDVVQGYIRSLKDESRHNTRVAADSRVRDARAQEIELRVGERSRRLVDMDEALGAMDEVVGRVRIEFAGLPARFTRDLDVRERLEAEIDAALNRIAAGLGEEAFVLRTGRDPTAARTENPA